MNDKKLIKDKTGTNKYCKLKTIIFEMQNNSAVKGP